MLPFRNFSWQIVIYYISVLHFPLRSSSFPLCLIYACIQHYWTVWDCKLILFLCIFLVLWIMFTLSHVLWVISSSVVQHLSAEYGTLNSYMLFELLWWGLCWPTWCNYSIMAHIRGILKIFMISGSLIHPHENGGYAYPILCTLRSSLYWYCLEESDSPSLPTVSYTWPCTPIVGFRNSLLWHLLPGRKLLQEMEKCNIATGNIR